MPDDLILRSWKEIAEYLGCDVKTCARWESECGLPVRRFDPASKRSRVFANKSELEAWLADRQSPKHEAAAVPRRRGGRTAVIAASLLLGAPLAWFGLKPVLFPSAAIPVIGVFPLQAANASPAEAYKAQEIRNEILGRLTFGGQVKVVSMPESPARTEGAMAALRIAGLPEPDYLLQAGFRPDNQFSALNFSLLDAKTGLALWNHVYEKAVANISYCLKDMCAEVLARIDFPGRRSTGPNPGPAASDPSSFGGDKMGLSVIDHEASDPWSLCVEASRFADMGDAAANDVAMDLFRKAREADPAFAHAYIGLAKCYANFVNYQGRKEISWLDKSDELLARAQDLEPDLPAYFAVRIKNLMMREFLLDGDTSREYFRVAGQALTRYPYDAKLSGIIGYCHVKRFDRTGRPADLNEAVRLLRIAYNADRTAIINMAFVELLMLKREFGQAMSVCVEVEQDHPLPIIAYRRGEILYYQGDLAGSLAAFRSCTTPVDLRIGALYYEGMIAARRGDRSRALAVLNEIELLSPHKAALSLDHLREASIYAGLGLNDRSDTLLQEGLAKLGNAGTYFARSYLEIDPNFTNLRRSLVLPRAGVRAQPR
jgi:TolB-like protein